MSEWQEVSLGQITNKIGSGATPKGGGESYKQSGISLIRSQNVLDFKFSSNGLAFIDESQAYELRNVSVEKDDVLLNITGDSVARCCVVPESVLPARVNQHVAIIRAKKEISDNHYIYYSLQSLKEDLLMQSEIGATRNALTKVMLENLKISIPPLEEQKAIASVLRSLDDKIDLLHRQNTILERMAETLFRQWFVEEAQEDWEELPLKEVVDIAIGRTPPRQEHQWFSEYDTDVKWISIKDLGNDGVYIFKTSEYLTKDAISKFNIPLIPKDTVVLSFKMTLGRVAITTQEMLSNEAIAHFKFNAKTPFIKEYLFLFLKSYKWELLGSTSSIVTAINSAMIKDMEISIPDNETMNKFKDSTEPLFNKIKSNQQQIQTIEKLRDNLLPKLMSGEVRVKI